MSKSPTSKAPYERVLASAAEQLQFLTHNNMELVFKRDKWPLPNLSRTLLLRISIRNYKSWHHYNIMVKLLLKSVFTRKWL